MLTAAARRKIAQQTEVEWVGEIAGVVFVAVPLEDRRPAAAVAMALTSAIDQHYQGPDLAVR